MPTVYVAQPLAETDYRLVGYTSQGAVLEYFDTYSQSWRQELWIRWHHSDQGQPFEFGEHCWTFYCALKPQDYLHIED